MLLFDAASRQRPVNIITQFTEYISAVEARTLKQAKL